MIEFLIATTIYNAKLEPKWVLTDFNSIRHCECLRLPNYVQQFCKLGGGWELVSDWQVFDEELPARTYLLNDRKRELERLSNPLEIYVWDDLKDEN